MVESAGKDVEGGKGETPETSWFEMETEETGKICFVNMMQGEQTDEKEG